jgi:hypothetical protein
LAASITLLGLLFVATVLLSSIVLVEQMAVAACSVNLDLCDFALLGVTTWITPAVAGLSAAGTVIAIIRKPAKSRRIGWPPALGLAATVIAFLVASGLISIALSGARA